MENCKTKGKSYAIQNSKFTNTKYLVIFDKAKDGAIWAQVPGLPGCFSSGDTTEEDKKNVIEAIELHIEGLREEGRPIPKPETQVDFVMVA